MSINSPVKSTAKKIINTKSVLSIYVYNVIENEWQFIKNSRNKDKITSEIDCSENDADLFYMGEATGNDLLYISPKRNSNTFLQYVGSIMGTRNTTIICPKIHSHLICDDLLKDADALAFIKDKCKSYDEVVLTGYATTEQFYKLKNRLLKFGIPVSTPETPEFENAWTVNFFGSKSGIRQFAQKSANKEPDFVMPDGLICTGKFEASKIAANKYLSQNGVVIKSDKGCSGDGLFIFRDGDLSKDYKLCEKEIYEKFNGEKYWENLPIIIEDYIPANFSQNGAFPSIEYRIHKNGRIEMLYYGTMIISKEGTYRGIEIHESVLNDRVTAQIVDMGYYIAEQYAEAKYRGYFDIDMILGKNNQLYVTESNTRNTGGTHIYKIARKFFGKDFMSETYIYSRLPYYITPKRKISFKDLLSLLQPYLFSHKTKEGVILHSEIRLRENRVPYTVFGRSKKRAYEINSKVMDILDLIK